MRRTPHERKRLVEPVLDAPRVEEPTSRGTVQGQHHPSFRMAPFCKTDGATVGRCRDVSRPVDGKWAGLLSHEPSISSRPSVAQTPRVRRVWLDRGGGCVIRSPRGARGCQHTLASGCSNGVAGGVLLFAYGLNTSSGTVAFQTLRPRGAPSEGSRTHFRSLGRHLAERTRSAAVSRWSSGAARYSLLAASC
jgi:hypothetical protein